MTWLRDVVYKLNRIGPRMDPCGTPNGRCCGQDNVPDMLILRYLSDMSLTTEELGQKCQNIYGGVVKGLNDQLYQKQLSDQVK